MKILILFVLLVGAAHCSPTYSAENYGPYAIADAAAVDGDTIRGDILIWPGLVANYSIRVAGIDTPEFKGNGTRPIPACEKVLAKAAMEFTDRWLAANHPIYVRHVKRDKYGMRFEASVENGKGELLGGALLAAGHARASTGGKRQSWCP